MKFSEIDLVCVEPFAVRAEKASALFDSELIFSLVVQARWVKPVAKGNRLTLYDMEDLRSAWRRLKLEGLDALKSAAASAAAESEGG
jgi:hypothetical protein